MELSHREYGITRRSSRATGGHSAGSEIPLRLFQRTPVYSPPPLKDMYVCICVYVDIYIFRRTLNSHEIYR